MLNYGCEVWGYHKADDVEKVHICYIKHILKGRKSAVNYMVSILRYPDIMKTIFKKNISLLYMPSLALGFNSELSSISSYKHFKIQLSVQINLNQYLSISQYFSIYIGNIPNSEIEVM
jgi:hypothetical protein